ncbi:hypothetical protein [Anaeromyxobacter paludicola]|uniref:hypothetical protein n=1 Tax=Anaeromyxobacter paludicola TaxID=2918171 RepID=UPI0020BFAF34|nr:hypothetical protein [Anaeromyxobacter paludicola]
MSVPVYNFSTCTRCRQLVGSCAGCTEGAFFDADGSVLLPLVYGHESIAGNMPMSSLPSVGCRECNAAFGYLHHVGCRAEVCPKCGGLIVECGCSLKWRPQIKA